MNLARVSIILIITALVTIGVSKLTTGIGTDLETINLPEGKYTGKTVNDVPHGDGVFQRADGYIYKGNFKYGHMEGEGELLIPNVGRYEGHFAGGSPNGEGVLTLSNGTIFRGFFQLGKLNGMGTVIFPDQRIYVGEFSRGNPEGSGTCKDLNGETYPCKLVDGKLER